MAINRTFNIPLFLDANAPPAASAAADDVDLILETIQGVRRHVRFDTSRRNLDGSSASEVQDKLSDASTAISVGCTLLDTGLRDAGWNVEVHHLCVPSIAINSVSTEAYGRMEDLDIKMLFPAADQTKMLDGITADSLASSCLFGKERDSSGRITVTTSVDEQGSRTSLYSKLLAQMHESYQANVSELSSDETSSSFARDPTSLNGCIFTDRKTGLALIEHAKAVPGLHLSPGRMRPSSGASCIFSIAHLDIADANVRNAFGEATAVQNVLDVIGLNAEARAVSDALRRTLDPAAYVGSNMLPVSLGGNTEDGEFVKTLVLHLSFFLEAVNSLDAIATPLQASANITDAPIPSGRPMNLIEKIITHSAIGLEKPEVMTGQMVCVHVDWVLTSELLWGGMEKTYNQMKRPRPYRNDRIWLAVDHTVDPRTINLPKQQKLMARSERFRDEAKIISYLPANTSIMHTDFTREKAQPGTIVVGSDSHTCSAGSMGTFAVGFGAADVVMPLVTGQTWFRVPKVCRINSVGKLAYGLSGKDVILHVLGQFKRNTIAFQRGVEYGGPGLSELSMDARFAIANITTEFGGMGACFEADDSTASWIRGRRFKQDRTGGSFFRPDTGAEYEKVRTIDLSDVAFTMALYPNPDDVVDITSKAGTALDGCFIGACTTTEEELILGALVLEAGLKSGLRSTTKVKRRVTPGSLIITTKLQQLGLDKVYEEAGFEIGAPGCSYCVGINDVDVAQEGEVWLSSQNRNFRNRMGMGSFGNITSAAAVAA